VFAGHLSDLPVDGGGSRARLAQPQSFDQLLQLGELPPRPAVRSRLPRQTRQAMLAVLLDPPARRAGWDALLARQSSKRLARFEVGLQLTEAL
jgi:hypothetical protein